MEDTNFTLYNQYIALDWSQQTVALARMSSTSSKVETIMFEPKPKIIKEYLKKLKGKIILTLEETTTAHWLYVEFRESVDKILICDPYTNKLLSQGAKTDKIDASKLCLLLRSSLLKEVYHSLEVSYKLRQLVSSYNDIINASVRFKNQRSAMFRAKGQDHKNENSLVGKDKIGSFVLEHHDLAIESMNKIRMGYEKVFNQVRKGNKIIKLLEEIPGIGPKTSVMIYATVIDAHRFETKYKYWAYCGLARHQKQSGGRNYGSKKIRHSKVLKYCYKLASKTTIGGKSDIRQYYEYLLSKGFSLRDARNQITRYIAKVSYAVMKNKISYRPYQWREQKKKQ